MRITDTPVLLSDKFDEKFEQKVLQLFLRERTFAAKYFTVIKPHYFGTMQHRALFEAFYEYFLQYKKPPSRYEMGVQILREHADQEQVVESLKELLETLYTDDLPNVEYFDHLIIDFVKKAQLSSVLWDAVQNFETLDTTKFFGRISGIAGLENKTADLGICSDDFASRLALKDEFDTLGCPTTFKSFNSMVRGGLRNGELAVLMAPTNRGKTHFLINFGRSFLTMGACVVHYSLEMPEPDIMDRYIASMTHTPIDDLGSQPLYKGIVGALQNYKIFTDKKLYIKFFSAKTASIQDIAGHLSMLMDTGVKPDLVLLDYIDLLKPSRERKEKRHELGDLYEEVRAFGMEHNLPVMTASQTNRAGEMADHDPTTKKVGKKSRSLNISHIAEDWSKANTADYIWGIRRPFKHPVASPDFLTILDTLKSRHSSRESKIGFKTDFARCYIEEISLDGVSLKEEDEDE